jgi:nucleotide-binding universal stress UspA family protein
MNRNHYTIVVGIDFEADGDRAFDAAIDLGHAHHADVHVVWVGADLGSALGVPAEPRIVADQKKSGLEHLDTYCRRRLEQLQEKYGDLGIANLILHFRAGDPSARIVQLAVDIDADLIVVGTHGRRGLKRLLLGSVAAGVLGSARCPVHLARLKDHEGIGEVPEIEPPCPRCVAVRRQSSGDSWWCPTHSADRMPPPHHYGYTERTATARSPFGAAFD